MKLNKAIEILRHGADNWRDATCPGTAAALELGIEALKHLQLRRRVHPAGNSDPLPGETDE